MRGWLTITKSGRRMTTCSLKLARSSEVAACRATQPADTNECQTGVARDGHPYNLVSSSNARVRLNLPSLCIAAIARSRAGAMYCT